MKKKNSFFICVVIITVANVLMATVLNGGEEVFSNIFVIGITLLLSPGFVWAIDNEKTSFIRIESSSLLMLATISVMRLVNRVDELPYMVNSAGVVIAIGLGVLLLVVAVVRVSRKRD